MKSDMVFIPAMIEIELPFSGFYDSQWSGIVDSWEERESEYLSERDAESREGFEGLPECFEFNSESAYAESMFAAMDYRAAYTAIAKDYTAYFWEHICEELNIPQDINQIEFVEMTSPREYNFSTDRIFARINSRAMRYIHKIARSDLKVFQDVLRERHKSRDGFISSYEWRLNDWNMSCDEMDYIQLESVLIAAMRIHGVNMESDIFDSVFYPIAEQDYKYCDSAMDWPKLKEEYQEKRQASILAFLDSCAADDDAKTVAQYIGLASDETKSELFGTWPDLECAIMEFSDSNYRCSLTPDLFEMKGL